MVCLHKTKTKHSPLTALSSSPNIKVSEPFHTAQQLLPSEKEPLPMTCNTNRTYFLCNVMVEFMLGTD